MSTERSPKHGSIHTHSQRLMQAHKYTVEPPKQADPTPGYDWKFLGVTGTPTSEREITMFIWTWAWLPREGTP